MLDTSHVWKLVSNIKAKNHNQSCELVALYVSCSGTEAAHSPRHANAEQKQKRIVPQMEDGELKQ